MKISITGKSGLLSQELQKIYQKIIVMDSLNYDITQSNIYNKIKKLNPDVIIHAGAITNSNFIKNNPIQTITTNIIGTANLSNYCIAENKKIVYISTDYVYEGINGNYKEIDPILPHNEYAWTKLGGECSVKLVPNHLIIRTSFGSSKFPYEGAWSNQIVSKDYVDVIAPKILKAVLANITGTLNIGTESKTLYEYAQKRNQVKSIQNSHNTNFTLNTSRYENLFSD